MLRSVLCGATLIGGLFWTLYLVYGWWAFTSLLALGAASTVVRQGLLESLVSQTVVAVVLLGIGAVLREPKVIRRRVASRQKAGRSTGSREGGRDSLRGIEHYDPLVDGSEAGDTVRMALIRKYRIRRDDTLGLIICQGQAFRSLDEALEHARQAELEAGRQARAHHAGLEDPDMQAARAYGSTTQTSGAEEPRDSGASAGSAEGGRAVAAVMRELLRPGPLGSPPEAAATSRGGARGAAAPDRTVVPAT